MEHFLRSLGSYCQHLYDSVVDLYPALSGDVLVGSAMAVLASSYSVRSESSGADDNYDAMLSAAAAIASTSSATLSDIGAVHAERAAHAWPSDALPREAVAVTSRSVDTYSTLSTSSVVSKRTKRGTSRRVVRYGRSFVVGSTSGGNPLTALDVERPYPLDVTLETLRRVEQYADGIDLASIATAAYDLPMIGGEFQSWSEVLPEDVSARLGAEPYSYAEHTSGPWIGTNERPLPRSAGRLRVTARRRDSDPTDRSRIADRVTELVSAGDRVAVRREVPAVVIRDDSGRVVETRSARVAVRTAPTETLHLGHSTVTRVPSKRDTRSTSKRSYSESFVIRSADVLSGLVAIAETLDADRSALWANEARTIGGTITRARSGRYSATVLGSDVKCKGARTSSALAKQLAPAFL